MEIQTPGVPQASELRVPAARKVVIGKSQEGGTGGFGEEPKGGRGRKGGVDRAMRK